MPKIIFHRSKCIGCNACVEAAPTRWRMSKKDGRCNLIGSTDKKGIYQAQIHDEELEANERAAEHCPAKIIQVDPR